MIFGKKKTELQVNPEVESKPSNGSANGTATNGTSGDDGWTGNYGEPAPQGAASAPPAAEPSAKQLDPEIVKKITGVRTKVHETFGQVALSMMAVPRYRQLSIVDLNQHVLEPLIRDRIAIAKSGDDSTPGGQALAGIAIWASVSEEVDAKIREQVRAGVFPVRLKPEDWTSGEINWLFDVIAPSQRLTTSVIANFRQVLKSGDLRIHPLVTKLVDPEALKKMGAAPIKTGVEQSSSTAT